MSVDWRVLLTSIGVEWTDHGPNTSRGNLNINCPMCMGADPSYHLRISEDTGYYFCLRGGRAHAGQAPDRLLIELGIDRVDVFRLLRDFELGSRNTPTIEAPRDTQRQWNKFESIECWMGPRGYMQDRGFVGDSAHPDYDLRYTDRGPHKYRILFPIRYDGVLAGWSGRSIYDKTPPYKMEHGGQDGHIYIPSRLDQIVVITEGPMDALKTTMGTAGTGVSALAILGLEFGPSKIARLQRALVNARKVVVCLDKTVSLATSREVIRELRSALLHVRPNPPIITRIAPAGGHKDNGNASFKELEAWSRQLTLIQ